ncbi:hypothetical protein DCAR_0417523 [Daucus carota subsp. sativus]|uniref:CID domain-containing protein n=1 Tax=Daucus carota subsp. sativus TaxID=79200 RepID=A0AAF0WXY7_DAUCS|nr:PREDICTED: regulation of nuclear pre-mRNA domain-containing protein 1B-like [Daucus carota subsp. sativus]WOG98182.1 hypothetical protein DCAR_0417523 [Daucus carota subsp. sativus]
MSDEAFDGQILTEKLSKLNSSQQSIESLSRWCITHRKKAKQIVESWDKLFKSAQRDQRVSFLYLANDILQNSKRKGTEFMNEFWKVLPAALKYVYETGDDSGKKAACRLVNIWEERKVFGSRGQNLKDEMLGKNPPPVPALPSNGKSSNPIKIVKRDAHSLRIKLAVGALPEKIVTSYHSVHDQNVDEEAAFNKFKSVILRGGEIERNVEEMSAHGSVQGSHLAEDIQEQESVLQQCINQLESNEETRTALVSLLKDALQNQEPALERIRTQLQVARGQLDQVVTLRGRIMSPPVFAHSQQLDTTKAAEENLSLPQLTNLPPSAQTMMTAISKTTEDENKKAAAAAVVAKLAASTSSAQMLTSVFSSLVAEEAASISGGLKSAGFSTGMSLFPPEKRPRLEKPMSGPDANNSEAGNSSYFTSLQQQPASNVPVTSVQSMSQPGHMQSPFPPPAPPPPPPGPLSNSPTNQFVQPASLMPYGYGSTSLPPPPPLPSHVTMGLTRPAPPPQLQQSQAQQQNNNSGYYRPPGIGFYGQNHQPAPPPVQRQ